MLFRHLRRCAPVIALLLFALSGCHRPPPEARPEPAAAAAPGPAPAPAPAVGAETLAARADALLADYRRMIVLTQDIDARPAADRAAATSVGQMLFHSLQQRQQALLAQAAAPQAAGDLSALLDRIENEPDWFDADRLAFKDLLEDIAARNVASHSIAGLRLARRARDDLAVLGEIEQAYDRPPAPEGPGAVVARGLAMLGDPPRIRLVT